MKLSELKRIVDHYREWESYHGDPEVVVEITTSGSVGGTPAVNVKWAGVGIDWDENKFLIHTEEPVMKVNQKTIDDLRKEAEKIGWNMYENRNLKAEVKKLRAQLNATRPNTDSA